MTNTATIQHGMEVVGSDSGYVGVVDTIEGSSIRLAHEDPEPGGDYHYLPLDWVESIDQSVHLNKPHDDAMREWNAAPIGAGGG